MCSPYFSKGIATPIRPVDSIDRLPTNGSDEDGTCDALAVPMKSKAGISMPVFFANDSGEEYAFFGIFKIEDRKRWTSGSQPSSSWMPPAVPNQTSRNIRQFACGWRTERSSWNAGMTSGYERVHKNRLRPGF